MSQAAAKQTFGECREGQYPAALLRCKFDAPSACCRVVDFKKITVTPDDERAWFKKQPQWSKSNRYAELKAWIYI